jgi:hypothetical protein
MNRGDEQSFPALPVTRARAELYELVDMLLDGRTHMVEISHRDHPEGVVMVRKSEFMGMKQELAALRGRTGPAARPLRGLGELTVAPEDVLAPLRAAQAALAKAKLDAITGADHEGKEGSA